MINRETDQLGQRLKTISADVKLYVEKRIELILLKIGERASEWAAESIHKLIGIVLLAIGLIFTLATLAIFLGEVLESMPLGFLIVSVLLLTMGGLSFYLKPHSFTDSLQQQFESEVMKVLSMDGKRPEKSQEIRKSNEPVTGEPVNRTEQI